MSNNYDGSSSSNSSKEVQLFLIPQPGAKPEFLAKLRRKEDPQNVWNSIPTDQIVLEGYTRDAWAVAAPKSRQFHKVLTESVDGRNKVPGFLNYLKERQKVAYGRIEKSCMVLVVSNLQQQPSTQHTNCMECHICSDMTQLANCSLRPKQPPPQTTRAAAGSANPAAAAVPAAAEKKRGGFLGKLVGAQQRTNQHVINSTAKSVRTTSQQQNQQISSSLTGNNNFGDASNAAAVEVAPAVPTRTSGEVLADFRQSMQDRMLDFDISPEEVLRIPLNLAEHQAGLSVEDKTRVTMEILKYMVYEAAEEVNDEWIAYKEPTEFVDEMVICVYKEGAAPPHVLEETNQGELPDEIRGQQQALQQERIRTVTAAENKKKALIEQAAHKSVDYHDPNDNEGAGGGGGESELAALNTKKRDRRSVEDYQRDKRAKMS